MHSHIVDLIPYGDVFVSLFVRLGVPFFFVATGFFMGKKCFGPDDSSTVINKTTKRLFKILIVFGLLGEFLYVIITVLKEPGVNFGYVVLKVMQHLVFYPSNAMWYVLACIVAINLLRPFIKHNKLWLALALGIVLYLIALLGNNYFFIIDGTWLGHAMLFYEKICMSTRNGLFVGFLFILLGVIIAKHEVNLTKYKWINLILLIISYALFVAEYFTIRNLKHIDDGALYLTFVLLIFVLFINCATYINKGNTTLYRNLSSSIYFLHYPILKIVRIVYFLITKQSIDILSQFCATIIILVPFLVFCYTTKKQPLYDLIR